MARIHTTLAIQEDLYSKLKKYSEQTKRSKNNIMEEALTSYFQRREIEQKEIDAMARGE